MAVIQITQVVDEHTLKEIVKLKTDAWEQLHRIFPVQVSKDEPLQVLVDLMDDSGQDLIADPLCISASQALWLLQGFFSRPKTEWSKIQLT